MKIEGKVAVVTGAASGIGEATALELARRGAKVVALVDRSERVREVARAISDAVGRPAAEPFVGDTTDERFRAQVFDRAAAQYGVPSVCVPAAGIARAALETGLLGPEVIFMAEGAHDPATSPAIGLGSIASQGER